MFAITDFCPACKKPVWEMLADFKVLLTTNNNKVITCVYCGCLFCPQSTIEQELIESGIVTINELSKK